MDAKEEAGRGCSEGKFTGEKQEVREMMVSNQLSCMDTGSLVEDVTYIFPSWGL